MKVMFKNKECEIKKKEFYCKAGSYDHKHRTGWVIEFENKILVGDRVRLTNRNYGADGNEQPEFKTRKALLEYVNDVNAGD